VTLSFVLKGTAGSVWVGCQKAADLGAWTFTAMPGGGTVAATVTWADGYWSEQPATQIRLVVGRGEWRWRVSAGAAGAGTYPVSGPPEER
jgi:hypothetical protein